ncbi:MAG: Hsp20/alpha crystallin family protein [Bdellovibrionales bacterium]|nr:Hsp20/alpha crystallin family protein [Bdellovibrionales bacterium]
MLLPQRRRLFIDDFGRDFDRLFGCAVPAVASDKSQLASWAPAIDIEETEEGLNLHVDLPGVATDAIEVNVEEGTLLISGERNTEKKENKGNFLRVERRHGRFERSVKLPQWADVNGISAQGKNGELTIKIPRAESSKARKIEIH